MGKCLHKGTIIFFHSSTDTFLDVFRRITTHQCGYRVSIYSSVHHSDKIVFSGSKVQNGGHLIGNLWIEELCWAVFVSSMYDLWLYLNREQDP